MTIWTWIAMIAAMLWPFVFAATFTYASERSIYWRNQPTFRQFLRRTFKGTPYPK